MTGGGGFLGGAIVRRLVERGDRVESFSRGRHPALARLGVRHHRGDLGDPAAVRRAVADQDAVVHTAAKAGVWGPFEDYWRANVSGTAHVVAACRQAGVERLVYTSTPSVVHRGQDLAAVDEAAPYAERFGSPYPLSKTAAERLVLSADGAGLRTVALRPHLVWGPGDPHLVPRILARARAGVLALPGGGGNEVDTTYVDNAADAHVAALDRLSSGAACAGQAYFITNGEPRPLRDILLAICRAAGLEPRLVSLPMPLARRLGAALEGAYGAIGLQREPPLTRFVVEQLGTAHHFDIRAAKRDLAWAPRVSLEEGFRRLAAAWDERGERG